MLFDEVFSEDEFLNEKVKDLHDLARSGSCCRWIQPHIDSYLAAVGYFMEKSDKMARKMVMCIQDVPQEGTLPDLGYHIRYMLSMARSNSKMTHERCGEYAVKMLYLTLPCIKRQVIRSKEKERGKERYDVGIRVLLGLLLGLYPSSVKYPPFSVRVAIYKRVHCLITGGGGSEFCEKYCSLMTVAFMEYCAHVIPTYMPVEFEVLCGEPGMQGFFSSCSIICDTFRQEQIQTGLEDWSVLDEYSKVLVDKHTRSCKNRVHNKLHSAFKINLSMSFCLENMPFIVPYSMHLEDSSHAIMGNEMAFLGLDRGEGSDVLRSVVAMQRAITVHRLPQNMIELQMKALRKQMQVCERSAMSGTILYTCVHCIMHGQGSRRDWSKMPMRGQCKMDIERGVLVCSSCNSDSVLSISTLGRVVSLKHNKFYLAPCCCSVQPYTGIGDEFQCVFDHDKMDYIVKCRHLPLGQPRYVKKRCEICNNVAVGAHSAVDHLTGEMKTVHLCQRHTPHEDMLRQVANWRQLEGEIRRKDRPFFRGER